MEFEGNGFPAASGGGPPSLEEGRIPGPPKKNTTDRAMEAIIKER